MNKIVRENRPASELPEDLRPTDDPNARVTVTIEEEPVGDEQRPERVMTLEEWVWLTFAYRSAEQLGVTSAGDEYLDDVAAAVGGAVKRYEKCSPEVLGHDGKAVDIQTLLKVAERWKRAIARLVEKTRTIDE